MSKKNVQENLDAKNSLTFFHFLCFLLNEKIYFFNMFQNIALLLQQKKMATFGGINRQLYCERLIAKVTGTPVGRVTSRSLGQGTPPLSTTPPPSQEPLREQAVATSLDSFTRNKTCLMLQELP